MLKKIISGGQTGVDQAALDAAIARGFPYGGFIPRGRWTEAGPLDDRYEMTLTESARPDSRTRKNVRAADGTLIISRGPLMGGSAFTKKYAGKQRKPCLHIDLGAEGADQSLTSIKQWLEGHEIETLNVAGPRASMCEGIYDDAKELLERLLDKRSDRMVGDAHPAHGRKS